LLKVTHPASAAAVTTTLATGLNGPSALAVDGSGNVYIADTGNSAIKKWTASTQQITTLIPGIAATGVAVDGAGNLYIASGFTVGAVDLSVKMWTASTQQITTLASGTPYYGVAVDLAGNVYLSDVDNGVIDEWNATTHQVAPGGILHFRRAAGRQPRQRLHRRYRQQCNQSLDGGDTAGDHSGLLGTQWANWSGMVHWRRLNHRRYG
jgi:DNA-binding beta-propeller fold protein YncE